MKTWRISYALVFFISLFQPVLATVFVTHGLGTEGIKYYQNSKYIDLIKESAKSLGHETICIPWLDQDNLEKEFAGILPQERIYSAIKIAKEILNEIKTGNPIILIGHGYGGQVMACATRLLNPENKNLTDSFIYELIYLIKNCGKETYDSDNSKSKKTRTISPNALLNTLVIGWRISKKVLNAIEESEIINKNLIKLVKQDISLKFIEETKDAWKNAFNEIQNYKNKLFKNGFDHKNSIQMIYTIGTAYNGDMAFSPDMNVVQYHVNFYSSADSIAHIPGLPIWGKKLAPKNPNCANVGVLFEPTKSFAPKHTDFCGNVLMAPWILQIPNGLQAKNLGGFEQFEWGENSMITFYSGMIPAFNAN